MGCGIRLIHLHDLPPFVLSRHLCEREREADLGNAEHGKRMAVRSMAGQMCVCVVAPCGQEERRGAPLPPLFQVLRHLMV